MRAFLLTLAAVHGWNDCEFPEVGYFAAEEGIGYSSGYAGAAMNGKMYMGGQTKGNFALMGVVKDGIVPPEPAATIWGDATSNVQSLYVAEVDETGKMTKTWLLKGTALQVGQIGHGGQTNSIDSNGGMKAMLDHKHIAIQGGFKENMVLPDGVSYDSRTRADGSVRANSNDQVPFVMKLDVNTANGVGSGTTGWFKIMDDMSVKHLGGADTHYAEGDANGNVIVSYTGYAIYNASAPYYDRYGRLKCCGARLMPTHYLVKLSAADGSEVWRHEVPHYLTRCRAINEGSFFCVYSMTASDGPLEFKDADGNGVTMEAVDRSKTGLVKFNSDGIAQWAKPTHDSTDDKYIKFGVNGAGTLLAIAASSEGRGAKDVLSRINTENGEVMWTDNTFPYGTHGFRGCEVSEDGKDIVVFGQHNGPLEITDTAGSKMTLNTRGTYEAWVATFNAADGTGKWAIDGGSGGMDYFFILNIDPTNGDIYIGGNVYGHPPSFHWGDVTRANSMHGSQSASERAFFAQIKPTTKKPDCLREDWECSDAFGTTQSSAVKAGFCYIDRHCYAAGAYAPYPGSHCMKCDPTTSATAPISWSAPDTSTMCYIDGQCLDDGAHKQNYNSRTRSYVDDPCLKCDVATSTSEWTDVNGCHLSMASFKAACYDLTGISVISLADMESSNATLHTQVSTLTTEKATLTTEKQTLTTEKHTLTAEKETLTTEKQTLAAEKDTAVLALGVCEEGNTNMEVEDDCDDGMSKDVAIALIVVLCALFVLVLIILLFLISREKEGRPIFTIQPVGKTTTDATLTSATTTTADGGKV
jgi:hypothetical protein